MSNPREMGLTLSSSYPSLSYWGSTVLYTKDFIISYCSYNFAGKFVVDDITNLDCQGLKLRLTGLQCNQKSAQIKFLVIYSMADWCPLVFYCYCNNVNVSSISILCCT